MISDQPAIPPKIVWNLSIPCGEMARALGREQLQALHRANPFLDWGWFAFTWATFAVLWWALARLPIGPAWAALAALQALTLFNSFYSVRHDLFLHRRVAGNRGSYLLGVLCSLPLVQPYSELTLHMDHHKHVGWDLSEEFATDLDKRWKRWFCLTLVGFLLLLGRRLRSPGAPRPNAGFRFPDWYRRRLKREKLAHNLFFLALFALSFRYPMGILKGYVLPIAVFGPFVLMLRILFQHGETDPANPFHVAHYWRTPVWARLLLYNTLGDAHLAHHLYQQLPFYRAGRAADRFHALLAARNVPARGFLESLRMFFIEGREFRTRWSAAEVEPAAPAVLSGGALH